MYIYIDIYQYIVSCIQVSISDIYLEYNVEIP